MENTNIPRKVKRGEIYLYDFGANPESIQNGVRPVLVVQCDEGNDRKLRSTRDKCCSHDCHLTITIILDGTGSHNSRNTTTGSDQYRDK